MFYIDYLDLVQHPLPHAAFIHSLLEQLGMLLVIRRGGQTAYTSSYVKPTANSIQFTETPQRVDLLVTCWDRALVNPCSH